MLGRTIRERNTNVTYLRLCLVIVLASTCAASAYGQPTANLLRPDGWFIICPTPSDAKMEPVSPDGMRVAISAAAEPFYKIQLTQTISTAIPSSNRVRMTFRARSATRNPLRAVVEKTETPYTAIAEWNGTLTNEWKTYSMTGVSQGFGPKGLSVRMQVGQAAGTIEFAGIRLEELPPDPALITAREAVQPEAIKERIRRVRMGDLKVTVRDADGHPVPAARVHIQQTRHDFLFGCNFFMLDPASSEKWQMEYRERFTALFNYATLPFYWGAFEPQQGKPQHARLEGMAQWCRDHGVTAKGHPLVWHEVWPGWAPSEPDKAIPLLKQRIFDIVPHYAGQIGYWDVVNEANNAQDYPKTGQGAWVRRDGASSVVATALGWAREAAGKHPVTLLYNDYNTTEKNVQLLSELRDRKALPDAIGIQSHMHSGPWPIEQVWATAERFAQFGRPIHFTETTIISGERRFFDFRNPPADWPSTAEGERAQAEYVERFYSVLFSHPSVRAITWWDFSDRGAWLNAPAGFLRKDMSPKPVYDGLMDLVHHQWWTDTQATTDRNGVAGTRAFFGDYRITVQDDKGRKIEQAASFPFTSRSKTVEIILK